MVAHDPFEQVHQDIVQSLEISYNEFTRIRDSDGSTSSPQFLKAQENLKSSLSGLAQDLRALESSVKVIQKNPKKYGLTAKQASIRREQVAELKAHLESIQRQSKYYGLSSSRKASEPLSSDDKWDGPSDDAFMDQEDIEQQRLLKHQDELVEGVTESVFALRQQASTIGEELVSQTQDIARINGLADQVNNRMAHGLGRIKTILDQNEESMSGYCIGFLIFVLIILLVVLLVT